jgi:hypothetical protein
MALTPAEKQRRYRARLKEKPNGASPPIRPFDLIRAFDDASAGEQRALVWHIADTLLRAVKAPAAAPEPDKPKPDARQLDLEAAIAAAAVAVEASAPPAAKPAAIWRGHMPAVVAVEAEAQGIDAARLAGLWEQAAAEKQWLAGKSTITNVVKSWRRWLAHKLEG